MSGCSAMPSRRWSSTPSILVNNSGYIGRSQKAGQPSSQLAERTGTTERYVREWLEHHAASDLLVVDDPRAEPLARRYWLPPDHIPVLANPDHVRYEASTGVDIVRAGRGLPQLVEAFRVGNAPLPLSWEPEGRAEPNRARFIELARHRMAACDCRRRRTSFGPNHRRGSSTWPAAPAGPASPWRRPTPTSTSTGLIWTATPSGPLAGTPSGPAWLIE